MNGAKTVLRQEGFLELARAIFDYCKDLIGATSGYVALLSDSGEENEVLFLEAGGLPCRTAETWIKELLPKKSANVSFWN